MKIQSALFLLFFSVAMLTAQNEYEPSVTNPYGLKNPKAPEQLDDFKPLIGICDCDSERINPDGSWSEPVKMTWKYKYIMNGMAIQDETLKDDGAHSGSIRQFNTDSLKWYVHYYTSKGIPKTLPTWEGKKENGKIILFKKQNAPNGMEGFYRLTFYDMDASGYKWIGEWVDKSETVVFPTWKINCIRQKD